MASLTFCGSYSSTSCLFMWTELPAGNVLLYGDTATSPKSTGVQRWVHGSEYRQCAFGAARPIRHASVSIELLCPHSVTGCLHMWIQPHNQAGHSHGPFVCLRACSHVQCPLKSICVGSLFRGHFYWW